MELWQIGLIALAVAGLIALIVANRADRRSAARREVAIHSVPDREIPRLDPATPAPEYVTETVARQEPTGAPSTELDSAARAALRRLVASEKAIQLAAGYPDRAFATDSVTGWAVLPSPLILYVAERVTSMRELLPVLELLDAVSQSLVVVAPGFADEVVDTLRVNKIQRKLRVVPVPTSANLTRIITATGGDVVTAQDMQAGYLPREALGTASQWVSSRDASWVITD